MTGHLAVGAGPFHFRFTRIGIDKSLFDAKLASDKAQGLHEHNSARKIMRQPQPTVKSGKTAKPVVSSVKLTHPERIYWPDEGVTKQALADYYAEVWPFIRPFVIGRPLALLRAPEGVGGPVFFQKHAWRGMNKKIELFDDPKAVDAGDRDASDKDAGDKDAEHKLLIVSDLDGLIGLVQSGVLEIHPWGATTGDIEHPDMIIMDLDPGEDVAWPKVIDAAFEVKRRLEAEGLAAFVKTSGGKGLHIVAPLQPAGDWSVVKDFTHGIAEGMAGDEPEKYVATVAKAKRHGKILIDYLRNGRGNTAVAPYSTRARKGAAVSMPLAWEELSEAIGPAHFTLMNAPAKIAARAADPWGNFRDAARPIKVKT